MRGGDLFEYISGNGNLQENEAKHVMTRILGGLKFLHDKEICHRDLKPENILVGGTKRNPSIITLKVSPTRNQSLSSVFTPFQPHVPSCIPPPCSHFY
jgi:serine/threonine protein kinase